MKAGKYLFFLLLTLLLSCSGEEEAVTPDKPDKPDDPAEKYRVFLWVDASANYVNLSTAQGIANYVTKAKEIGVTHLVVDVKEPMGEVLYDSKIAPMNLNWKGVTRTRDYDYLRIFIDEARKNNIKVFAALNMFSGGSKSARRGPVYTDPAKKEWASITYNKDGSLQNSIETADQGEVMLNVSRKDVRDYQLSIIEEVITKYPGLDGITLDRCRWDGGFKGDFSTESRELFQKHIGKTLVRYPQDIFEWVYENGNYTRKNGTYFAQWNEWRCSVIFDFIKTAREKVKTIAPNMEFSAYVGAWYSSYYDVGVNWASNRYSPYDNPEYRSWATMSYHKYGYAQLLDLLMTGNYAYAVTKQESAGWSVEAMAEAAAAVTRGDTKVYAGLYLNDYVKSQGMDSSQLEKAIEMCFKKSNGVMIFDVIYLELYNCWDAAKAGISRGAALK